MKQLTNICTICAFAFTLGHYAIFAQQPPKPSAEELAKRAEILKEINRDIWVPFSEAIKTHNFDLWRSFHSEQMIRGEGDRNRVSLLAGYGEQMKTSMLQAKERGAKVALEFRFLQRMANNEAASERGIYEFSILNDKGEARKFYGKFHVISRKENGKWKILVDYDSNEEGTITEETYKRGMPVEDVNSL